MKQLFSYCKLSILSDKIKYAVIYFIALALFFCGFSAEYIKLGFFPTLLCFFIFLLSNIYGITHRVFVIRYLSLALADIFFGIKWHSIYHGLKFAPAFGISIPFLLIIICFTASLCFVAKENSPDLRLCIVCVSADLATSLLLLL